MLVAWGVLDAWGVLVSFCACVSESVVEEVLLPSGQEEP